MSAFVDRPEFKTAYDMMARPDALTLVIAGPSGSGKSSFLHHLCGLARQRGQFVVEMDLAKLESHSLEVLMKGILREVRVSIGQDASLQDWNSRLSWEAASTTLLKKSLEKVGGRLMLALDHADSLLAAPAVVRDRFFSILHDWHSLRADVNYGSIFKKLDLVIVARNPNDLVSNIHNSPFANVATHLDLGVAQSSLVAEGLVVEGGSSS